LSSLVGDPATGIYIATPVITEMQSSMDLKPLLRSLVPDAVQQQANVFGQPSYRGNQLCQWAFEKDVQNWDQMGNLPQAFRDQLAESYDLSGLQTQERQVSTDGTRKFLFKLRDSHNIESVIIPMADHVTFCLSTQVGCAMACTFCATARGGLVRNLDAGEIVEQIARLRHDLKEDPIPGMGDRQFNVVFMGMGEPLDNWPAVHTALQIMMSESGFAMSRRRIQISTSGPASGLQELIASEPGVGLTLSLGGSSDADRKKLMPVPGRTSVTEALDLASEYGKIAGRRVTIAWVVIDGQSDAMGQAKQLVSVLRGYHFKVNLIPLNPLADSSMAPAAGRTVVQFQKVLTDAGIPTFIRASGGRDIDAACGQLRRKRQST
jgi:23S rRNA (adenine2503-C2)-methyltransferase